MPGGKEKPTHEMVLDVTAEQIARTYAQGFLDAAGDAESVAVDDLEAVVDEVLHRHPDFAEAMRSAFIDHATRVGMVDRVFGGRVAPVVVNLLKVLSAHRRMPIAREVARQARLLHEQRHGRVPVTVRVAHAIDDALVDEIRESVRAKTGGEPVMHVEVAPELVGGLEVRVGDTVFDGSVRTAFARAHNAIVNQTVQAIESNPQRFTTAG